MCKEADASKEIRQPKNGEWLVLSHGARARKKIKVSVPSLSGLSNHLLTLPPFPFEMHWQPLTKSALLTLENNNNSNDCSHLAIFYSLPQYPGVLYKEKLNDRSSHDRKPPRPERQKELLLNTLSLLVREHRHHISRQDLALQISLKLIRGRRRNLKQAMGSTGFSVQNTVWFLQRVLLPP